MILGSVSLLLHSVYARRQGFGQCSPGCKICCISFQVFELAVSWTTLKYSLSPVIQIVIGRKEWTLPLYTTVLVELFSLKLILNLFQKHFWEESLFWKTNYQTSVQEEKEKFHKTYLGLSYFHTCFTKYCEISLCIILMPLIPFCVSQCCQAMTYQSNDKY